MAIPVNGNCAICGPVSFTTDDIKLIAYGAAAATHCLWRCPKCDTPWLQAVKEELRRDMWRAGIRQLTVRVEPPRPGVLNLDYMITINDDLEQL